MKYPPFLRPFLLSCILFYIPVVLYSQFSGKLDEVYLKNGGIIRGRILPREDSTKVVILTLSENQLVFPVTEVESIRMATYERMDPYRQVRGGYQNITGASLMIGSGQNEKDIIFSFTTVNGFQFRNRLFTGLGTGLEFFEYVSVPVSADLRYQFLNRKYSSFFHIKTGYSLPLESPEDTWGYHYTARGGWSLGLSTGLEINVNERNAWILEIGYRFQEMNTVYTTDWQPEEVIQTTRFNRLEICFALKFR